jgi:hypothetical protein
VDVDFQQRCDGSMELNMDARAERRTREILEINLVADILFLSNFGCCRIRSWFWKWELLLAFSTSDLKAFRMQQVGCWIRQQATRLHAVRKE